MLLLNALLLQPFPTALISKCRQMSLIRIIDATVCTVSKRLMSFDPRRVHPQ